MMGLSERLISIGPSYDSVSSDGEDDEDESERLREGTTRGEEEEEEEWKGKQAMEELIVLIHVFGIGTSLHPFLLSLCQCRVLTRDE